MMVERHIACTLTPEEMARVKEEYWASQHLYQAKAHMDGSAAVVVLTGDKEPLRPFLHRMVAREEKCCAFVTFHLSETADGFQLRLGSDSIDREIARSTRLDTGSIPSPRVQQGSLCVLSKGQRKCIHERVVGLLLSSVFYFVLAGLAEIGGGYLVWLYLREGKPMWYGLLGSAVLIAYGVIPTLQPEPAFGRVYAAYGGIFVALSVLWGWQVDKKAPDLYDWVGALVCLAGVAIIMWAPRR